MKILKIGKSIFRNIFLNIKIHITNNIQNQLYLCNHKICFFFLNNMFLKLTVLEQEYKSTIGILSLVLLLGSVLRCRALHKCLHHRLLHTLTINFTIRITRDRVQGPIYSPFLIQVKWRQWKRLGSGGHLTDRAIVHGPKHQTLLVFWVFFFKDRV